MSKNKFEYRKNKKGNANKVIYIGGVRLTEEQVNKLPKKDIDRLVDEKVLINKSDK